MTRPRLVGWGAFSPSRAVAVVIVALVAAALYFLAIIGAASLLKLEGGIGTGLITFAVPLLSALIAGIVLPTRHTRGWVKVMLAKHFFAHRYDYRAEWLRFNDTVGRVGDTEMPLDMRVVKAIADITDSPAGVLLVREDNGFITQAEWNWPTERTPDRGACDPILDLLDTGRIIEIDPFRVAADDLTRAPTPPQWMLDSSDIWAAVPLIHFDKLVGAVLLMRPTIARTLDWEDFDLLRVVGRQAASYLVEEQGQEALSDVQRFDEFNRRFAFIMHDIKNLVSQLTLVTRNAERHADNPEFRSDMIATLQSSTARMNEMLARLSQHNTARSEDPRPVAIHALLASLASATRAGRRIQIKDPAEMIVTVDPARFETALSHLVQNAIEASRPEQSIEIAVIDSEHEAGVMITDHGTGMSADFIRGQLFRPFASTKTGGFGIGAYEARSLLTAMGSRLTVESIPGKGTCFTAWLPKAKPVPEARAA